MSIVPNDRTIIDTETLSTDETDLQVIVEVWETNDLHSNFVGITTTTVSALPIRRTLSEVTVTARTWDDLR